MRRFQSPSKDGLPRAGNLASVGYSWLLSSISALGAGFVVGLGTILFRKRTHEALAAAIMAFAIAMTDAVLHVITIPLPLQRAFWSAAIVMLFVFGVVAIARNLARAGARSKE